MNSHSFWNVVPRLAKVAAFTAIASGVVVGLGVGMKSGFAEGEWTRGLIVGTSAAVWVLCLGYVYADARRRAMPAVLWTLLAALVPNLLGFLFYFALRKPAASPCRRCGRLIETGQRFCAWCGSAALSSGPGSPSGQTGLNSNPA
jgi:uncharacterized membrane protein (UPF0136 family)